MSDILKNNIIIKQKEQNRYYYDEMKKNKLKNTRIKQFTLNYDEIELMASLIETGIEVMQQKFEEDKLTKAQVTLILLKYNSVLNKIK